MMAGSIYDKLRQSPENPQPPQKIKYHRHRDLTGVTFTVLLILTLITIDLFSTFVFFQVLKDREQRFRFRNIDAAIILMGNHEQDHESMGEEIRRKIEHTAQMYQKKIIDTVLCVGGSGDQNNAFDSDYVREIFIAEGMSEDHIMADLRTDDSFGNWNIAKGHALNEEWRSVVIVGSPLERHRIMHIVQRQPLHDLRVQYAAYPISEIEEDLTFVSLYQQLHWEWFYSFLNLLPNSTQDLVGAWGIDQWIDQTALR
jgi:hypothetical protein